MSKGIAVALILHPLLIHAPALASRPAAVAEAAPPVIENIVLDRTLRLEGPRWNGAVVRNVTIRGVDGDGIFVKDVDDVRIENCTISHVTGRGIKLSVEGSSRGVQIVGNRIANTGLDGIIVGQRHAQGIDHRQLVLRDNEIAHTGLLGSGGLTHGIYVQSSDFLIEGNRVLDARDGNGISVRSSGVVRGNVVRGTGKSGIAYYADHMRGPSDRLVIEGNDVADSGRRQWRHAIDLLRVPRPDHVVHSFIIRDNLVRASHGPAIGVHRGYAALGIVPQLSGNRLLPHSAAARP